MPKLDKLQVSSRRTTWFQRKKKGKHDNSKHATDLRGVCLIHFNAYVHKCKLVQDLLEMETVVQLHNLSYSPDLSPCDFYVYFIEKKSVQTSILALKALLAVPLFSVYSMYPMSTYLHSEPALLD